MSTTIAGGDGAALHVEIDGADDAPVTVVLAHGWTLDNRTWGPVTRSLVSAPDDVRIVRYDHRGHGRSEMVEPSTMTIDQLAEDMAAVIAAAAPTGPLVLAGHSMGGMTIMALAERHPEVLERVRGIALVATASGGIAELTLGLPAIGASLFRAGERFLYGSQYFTNRRRFGNPALLAPGLRWMLLGANPSEEATRITIGTVSRCRPVTIAGFRPTLEEHDRDAALAAFATIPTAVLVGTQDRLTPVASARRINRALPSAQLHVLPDAGHMLPVERVEEVTRSIADLVSGAASARQAERATG